MRRRVWCFVVMAAALLAGCGFELRRAPDYAFQTVFSNLPENSPIGSKLRRNLEASGKLEFITDVRQVERAQVLFEQLFEAREKVIVGRTSTGAVREFQLRLRYRFRLRAQGGKELIPDSDIVVFRDISYNETGALSVESQEGLLYRDMENDLVQQILRRLAAVRSL